MEDQVRSLTGRQIGSYQVLALLGAGGMGEVYRAKDLQLGREVAIKVLPASFAHDSDRLARFRREARMLAALNHPHIGAIYGLEDIDDVRALVLELVEGPTLADRVAPGPIPVMEALTIAQQIAEALEAAHEKGIVHRDLKPANVKLTLDGTVKVLDFGLAKAIADDPTEPDQSHETTVSGDTCAGTILGTPTYMSPEQARGKPLDKRTDIWAFGCVLYQMLTGRLAFPGETVSDTIAAILSRQPDWRALPDRTPESVRRLLLRCLEIDPRRRLHDIADARLELDDALTALARPLQGTDDAHAQATAPTAPGGSLWLRARILAASCGFLVLLTAATWAYVSVTADRAVSEVIEADLARAERVVRRLHEVQLAQLGLTARLVASFPELKALLATDAATIQDFLLGYRQRIPGTPLLIALGPDGRVLGRTDDAGVPSGAGEEWPAVLVATPGEGAVVAVGDRPHFAVALASEAGGTVFGFLVAAEPVDQTFAAALSEATQDEVVLLSRQDVLASTLRAAQTPWRSLDAWHAYGGRADRSVDVRIGSQRFAAREVALTSAPAVSAIIVKSRDEAIGPYLRIQRGLAVIGLFALAGAILGGVWLSRMVTVLR